MRNLLKITFITFWLITSLFTDYVSAQNDSELGRFSSNYIVGCAPLTVNLTVNDNFGNIVRQYIYEESNTETNDTFHTYTSPGTYEITQIIQSQTPRTDRLTITVIEPTIPSFEIYNCSNNAAKVQITDEVYDFYRIYFLNDSLEVAPNTISDILQFPNSNTQSIRIKGFLNNSTNNCGVTSFNFDPISTISPPMITGLNIEQHCIGLVAADITFNINPFVRHQVQFTSDGTNFTVLDTIQNQSNYRRENISVNSREVCFRIVALDECANNTINSVTQCESGLALNMPLINDVSATFTNNGINFGWEEILINPSEYEIIRAPLGNGFNTIGSSDENTFNDSQVRNGNQVFNYQIISSDTCGNVSGPSVLIQPIFLSTSERSTNNYNFKWNNYNGWETSPTLIEYQLEVLDSEGSLLESYIISENNFSRNISQNADRNFRISAFDQSNNRFVYSNIITLDRTAEIIIPSAFSPNGDGLNDVFLPVLNEAESFEMKIFNRWGELLFVTSSIFTGWDGRYKRGVVQSGTYIYQISLKEENGSTVNQRGTFILIR